MPDNGAIPNSPAAPAARTPAMKNIKNNNAKKYYKHWAESGLGKGNVLMEARGEKIVRQVEIYGTKMVWADEHAHSDDRFLLADQPVSFLDFDEDDEISAREFESAWKKAREATGYPV
ncbi:hypothetical protein B9Y74_18875 [Stenotrophomonas maltophilia]|jgi:hypothetical protein|nr:hypothetical protein B9Y74_18875 [Stenotrophomonas maltophilia]